MNIVKNEEAMGVPTDVFRAFAEFLRKSSLAITRTGCCVAATLQQCRLLSHGLLNFVGLE
jgi:hypothetical protein